MSPDTPASEITGVQTAEGQAPPAVTPAPQTQGAVATPLAAAAPAAPEPPAPVGPPAAAGPAQITPTAPVAGAAAPVTPTPPQDKVMDAAWPFVGYTGPQPWEAVNTPTLTQDHKMLSSGSSGPEVVELAALLGYLGYSNSITEGRNPHAIYDQGVSAAVQGFCRDYGVEEDPAVRRARTADTVGPWIWEALVRAVHRKAAAAEQAAS